MKTNSQIKRASLVGALFLFFIPFVSNAQVVGGGGTQTYTNSTPTNSNVSTDDKYFSVNIGVISPEGTFSQPYSFGNMLFVNLATPFGYVPPRYASASNGLGAKTGYLLNFTGFSSLTKFAMGSGQGRFGLNYAFEFGYNPISWSNVPWSSYDMSVSTTGFFYDGLKFGPQINLNPMENMGICLYVTIDPYLTIPGGESANYNITDGSGVLHSGTYDVSDSAGIHVNINVSAGIMFYYKALMLGIEYNWVHTKYTGEVKQNETQYYPNGSTAVAPEYTYGFNSVIHTNMLKFTLGLRFGGHKKG